MLILKMLIAKLDQSVESVSLGFRLFLSVTSEPCMIEYKPIILKGDTLRKKLQHVLSV